MNNDIIFSEKSSDYKASRSNLSATLDILSSARDEAAKIKHPQARDLSIAITHLEDALFA